MKYEYKQSSLSREPGRWAGELNQLGEDGWELVQVIESIPFVAIFKKPKE